MRGYGFVSPQMEELSSIEVHGLTKRYGPVYALRDVSFNVRKGDVVGFLGPNGAGKTTTLRILCGLMAASAGTASVCGLSLAQHAKDVRRKIGYMAENNPLPEDMRVCEYLRFRGQLKGLSGKRLKERMDTVMELCDLNRKARKRLIGALSKGFRQRVGIAEAILAEPEVAMLDEPTIGLDPHQVLMIRELLAILRGQMTIIISSHILSEIEISCDQAIIMNHGRVVAMGSPDKLRREFVHDHTYILEVAGDAGLLQERLKGVDPELQVRFTEELLEGGFQRVVLQSDGKTDLSESLLDMLHRSPDHRVRLLNRRKPTLEDVFLSATRRGWDGPRESGTPGSHGPGNGENGHA